MKRAGLFFTIIFVLSAALHAQTISITLSGSETGYLYYTGSDGSIISTQCWFRSSVGLSGLPWLTTGVYSGQVSWMTDKNRQGIIISGNGISAGRGIFIHAGNRPSDSNGCIVIPSNQMDLLYNDLIRRGFHRNGDHFTIRVDR